MGLTAAQAIWFLIFAGPVAVWIAWSDLKFMRIPNKSVMVVAGVFLVIGLVALPFETYLWRWTHLLVILAIGFVMNMAGLIGGGDAKYAAAMAPFIALADLSNIVLIFAAMLLAAYATHRLFKRIPAVRKLTPDWKSWDAGRDFPMGLALSGTLLAYFVLAIMRGL